MRSRLTPDERKAEILAHARKLFFQSSFQATEMEDIRLACGISRGGLYHHFANKRAILGGLVAQELAPLVQALEGGAGNPIAALLRAGSGHLGGNPGVVSTLRTRDEFQDYLAALDEVFANHISALLCERLTDHVRKDVDAGHVGELFLTINAHINRRTLLSDWDAAQAADFAATALETLAPLLRDATEMRPIIDELRSKAGRQ